MATQTEGEARQTIIGTIFSLMLQRKAKAYPDVKVFLEKIGMSSGSYYKLQQGIGNPTVYTIERTAEALGLSPWEMIGIDAKVMRGWLAGQNIDLDKVGQVVETRRRAQQNMTLEDFEFPTESAAAPPVTAADKSLPKSLRKTRSGDERKTGGRKPEPPLAASKPTPKKRGPKPRKQ